MIHSDPALAVLHDLVSDAIQRVSLEEVISAVLVAVESARPDAFADAPPDGRRTPPSDRIAGMFSRRGMRLSPPRAGATQIADSEEILRAMPAYWITERTLARRLGYRSEVAVALSPYVRTAQPTVAGHHPLQRAMQALSNGGAVERRGWPGPPMWRATGRPLGPAALQAVRNDEQDVSAGCPRCGFDVQWSCGELHGAAHCGRSSRATQIPDDDSYGSGRCEWSGAVRREGDRVVIEATPARS